MGAASRGQGRGGPSRRGSVARWLVPAASLLAACTVTSVIGERQPDAATPEPPEDALCLDGHPLVSFGEGQEPVCAGRIAATVFRFALCLCEDVALGDDLRTDSHDSRDNPYDPEAIDRHGGGAVGVDEAGDVDGEAEVEGTLLLAGSGTLRTGDDLQVDGDLRTNGDLDVGDDILVRGDAWILGATAVADNMAVAGNLFHGEGNPPPDTADVGGVVQEADFRVPAPCLCGADRQVDVVAAVAEASRRSSNGEIGLDPRELAVGAGSARVELPCGVFFVEEISGEGELTLAVTGAAALLVRGDVDLSAGFMVELSEGASLDLFVAGSLSIAGGAVLGKPERASAVRLYVAGPVLDLSGAETLAASLYAPAAPALPTAADFSIFGSLFAASLASEGDVNVHYDRSILAAGDGCPLTPGLCAGPGDCDEGLACVAGSCAACLEDSDCGEPLACLLGRCVPLLY